jgi:hypothetical protein
MRSKRARGDEVDKNLCRSPRQFIETSASFRYELAGSGETGRGPRFAKFRPNCGDDVTGQRGKMREMLIGAECADAAARAGAAARSLALAGGLLRLTCP